MDSVDNRSQRDYHFECVVSGSNDIGEIVHEMKLNFQSCMYPYTVLEIRSLNSLSEIFSSFVEGTDESGFR